MNADGCFPLMAGGKSGFAVVSVGGTERIALDSSVITKSLHVEIVILIGNDADSRLSSHNWMPLRESVVHYYVIN